MGTNLFLDDGSCLSPRSLLYGSIQSLVVLVLRMIFIKGTSSRSIHTSYKLPVLILSVVVAFDSKYPLLISAYMVRWVCAI